jgi:hypothetical protein
LPLKVPGQDQNCEPRPFGFDRGVRAGAA